MTKKRSSSLTSSVRSKFWFGSKIMISLSIFICIYIILRLQSLSAIAVRDKAIGLGHIPVDLFSGTPKTAFLFLARRNLPLDFIWHAFFENADDGAFSIYIHTEPGFVFDKSTTRCPFFYGRQLSSRVQVEWGKSSMIEAEKLLIAAALQDPANQRFILLSDSCVPLYNFSYISSYALSSPKSFVDSFLDTKGGHYNPSMSPMLPHAKWRKGSQWITLIRKHAAVIVADDVVFPIFKKYCQRRPILDPFLAKESRHVSHWLTHKISNCIPDEHYIPTLLAMSELEDETERRTLTYTLWNESASNMEGNRWHPITFGYRDAHPERIKEIKGINHIYYGTESRTEWCRNNNTSVPCFLFARKFSRGAATRLLSIIR